MKFTTTEEWRHKETFHPPYIRLNHFFLSFFLFAVKHFWKYSVQRKMISPLSLMSVRFKLRVICRILFLIFTTRLITAPGRMSAVLTLTLVCLFFFTRSCPMLDRIFQWSLSHLRFLPFLLSSLSPHFLNRFQTRLILHFIFSRNGKETRSFFLLSIITSHYYKCSWADFDEIWKMEEIVLEKKKKNIRHSLFQIVSNYTIYFEK